MIAHHGCGATWVQNGSRTGHCASCHRTFHSEEAFDAHRFDGVCVDPGTLLRKDGSLAWETRTDSAGCEVWRTTVKLSPAARARFAALKAKRAAESVQAVAS